TTTFASTRCNPLHLLHFREQLFRLRSQDQIEPPFLDLIDSATEISAGADDDPGDEQITGSIAPSHYADRVAIGREGNKDTSLLVVQFKGRAQPHFPQLGQVLRSPILDTVSKVQGSNGLSADEHVHVHESSKDC